MGTPTGEEPTLIADDVRAYSREVRRRVRAGLEAKCFCGHPKWMHSMEKPHPCSHCTGCARYDGSQEGRTDG